MKLNNVRIWIITRLLGNMTDELCDVLCMKRCQHFLKYTIQCEQVFEDEIRKAESGQIKQAQEARQVNKTTVHMCSQIWITKEISSQ